MLLACGSAGLPTTSEPPAEIHTRIDGGVATGGGKIEVQEEHAEGLVTQLFPPQADPLRITPTGDARVETIGGRIITTSTWTFEGPPGHYEIGPFTTQWIDAQGQLQTATSPSLFVDVGTKPIKLGDLADIEDPPRVWNLRAIGIVAAVLGTLTVGGVVLAFRRPKRSKVVVVPVEPADKKAIREWERVRTDPTLDDMQRATELSRIFRDYAEIALHFPATRWTTSETLQHLEKQRHLPEGCVKQARALLRATDRVKYAGEGARAKLFDELDGDLRAFIGVTRPREWGAP